MPLSPVRSRMVALMHATLADNKEHHDWTYEAVRPMPVPPKWTPGLRVWGDCSKGCQYIAHWAEGPDPMGNGYGPYGNSQTMWLHLQHLSSLDELEVGDPITFGVYGEKHATLVKELMKAKNRTPEDVVLWSFGHQGAPNEYRLADDHRPYQLLKLPVKYVPTPEDRLRARTGWFAWVAWKLGEGDWRHHKPADRKVRPDVPRRPPVGWWVRYAQFKARRKHGDRAAG